MNRKEIEEKQKRVTDIQDILEKLDAILIRKQVNDAEWKLITDALKFQKDYLETEIEVWNRNVQCGAPTDGSNNADLSSHDEKTIVMKCIKLMNGLVGDFWEWYEWVHGENAVQELPDDERFCINKSIVEIVSWLLLSGTGHSGGTSSRAKCRTLGFDTGEYIEFGFEVEEND